MWYFSTVFKGNFPLSGLNISHITNSIYPQKDFNSRASLFSVILLSFKPFLNLLDNNKNDSCEIKMSSKVQAYLML